MGPNYLVFFNGKFMNSGYIGLSHRLTSIRWLTLLVGIMGLEEEFERVREDDTLPIGPVQKFHV